MFVHLYVSSMNHFLWVNEEYIRAFSEPSKGRAGGQCPPSRSCVAVPLPLASAQNGGFGVYAALDAMFYADSYAPMLSLAGLGKREGGVTGKGTEGTAQVCTAGRRVLHVRSVSEWAPLCVGPYSQGNLLGGSAGRGGAGLLALPAGQIPLCPGSMGLVPPTADIDKTQVRRLFFYFIHS